MMYTDWSVFSCPGCAVNNLSRTFKILNDALKLYSVKKAQGYNSTLLFFLFFFYHRCTFKQIYSAILARLSSVVCLFNSFGYRRGCIVHGHCKVNPLFREHDKSNICLLPPNTGAVEMTKKHIPSS